MKKIDKPWGYEIIYAHNEKYTGKILHILKGEQLSLQYHNVKDESLYLLHGEIELLVEEGGTLVKVHMSPGQSYRIVPKTRHRVSSLEESDVLEVSTPDLDDVIRLEDKYGRIKKNNYGVIMAGGHGTRFWPRSRRKTPKQLLDIISSEPMIRETIKRINKAVSVDNIYIVSNVEHQTSLENLVPEIVTENILLEPSPLNTAPCVGLAALVISRKNPQAVMSVFPADHLILDDDTLAKILNNAFDLASQQEVLITLGMKPTYPETGYGYIKTGEFYNNIDGHDVFHVDNFVEKPDNERAGEFINAGTYYWNSGIFIWKAETILKSIKKYLPDLYEHLMIIGKKLDAGGKMEAILAEEYPKINPVSIDYGILEHADNVLVVPCDIGWSDVGGWAALDALIERKSKDNNITWSKHISIDTKDCIIYSPKKLVATIGLENLIIIETDDAILVSTKDRAQDVKLIVESLKKSGLDEYL